jgi:hypothetical protein
MGENLDKDVLEEVFGSQAVKSVPIGQVKKGPLVMLVNLFHGSFISPLASLDENREGGKGHRGAFFPVSFVCRHERRRRREKDAGNLGAIIPQEGSCGKCQSGATGVHVVLIWIR